VVSAAATQDRATKTEETATAGAASKTRRRVPTRRFFESRPLLPSIVIPFMAAASPSRPARMVSAAHSDGQG